MVDNTMESESVKSQIMKVIKAERYYVATVVPLWLSFTIYMLVGIPIL